MPLPEQKLRRDVTRDIPRQGGAIATRLTEIGTARKNLQRDLGRARIDMLDTTGTPEASRILEDGIALGIQGGLLGMERAMIQALRNAGTPDAQIATILADTRSTLAETNFGEPSGLAIPPWVHSQRASSD